MVLFWLLMIFLFHMAKSGTVDQPVKVQQGPPDAKSLSKGRSTIPGVPEEFNNDYLNMDDEEFYQQIKEAILDINPELTTKEIEEIIAVFKEFGRRIIRARQKDLTEEEMDEILTKSCRIWADALQRELARKKGIIIPDSRQIPFPEQNFLVGAFTGIGRITEDIMSGMFAMLAGPADLLSSAEKASIIPDLGLGKGSNLTDLVAFELNPDTLKTLLKLDKAERTEEAGALPAGNSSSP